MIGVIVGGNSRFGDRNVRRRAAKALLASKVAGELVAASRYTVSFYSSRLFGLVVSSAVLAALLWEAGRLYVRLAVAVRREGGAGAVDVRSPAGGGDYDPRPMATTAPPEIFKAYDIRGLYGEQIDGDVAELIGAAFARVLAGLAGKPVRELRVGLGRDMRLSAPELAARYREGLLSEGVHVIDAGQVGSEMLYFLVGSRELDGGAMVTAGPSRSLPAPTACWTAGPRWTTTLRSSRATAGQALQTWSWDGIAWVRLSTKARYIVPRSARMRSP